MRRRGLLVPANQALSTRSKAHAGLAELGQADHARTALEGVERAAKVVSSPMLSGITSASRSRARRSAHFARFLQEDVLQVVFFQLGDFGVLERGQRGGADDLLWSSSGRGRRNPSYRRRSRLGFRAERGQALGNLCVDLLRTESRCRQPPRALLERSLAGDRTAAP